MGAFGHRQRGDHRADCGGFLQHLDMGAAQVAQRMGFGHGQGQGDLVCARRDRRRRTTRIGHQHRDGQAGDGAGVGDDLRRIRQLRQQLGGDETAHLYLPHAGRRLGGDPCLLGVQRHDRVDALQPVARSHFADQDIDVCHGAAFRLSCAICHISISNRKRHRAQANYAG